MALTMESIKEMMREMLEEQRASILNETKEILKKQEETFATIVSSNMAILTERLNNIEKQLKNTSDRLTTTEKNIEDLKEGVNFQEEVFESKIKDLNDRLDTDIEGYLDEVDDKMRVLEDRCRRNNLRIDGVKENASETWDDVEEKVQRVLQDKLQVEGVQIERAHRTGKRNEGRPRTIVMKLLSYKDKERILKVARNLKGTSIYMNEDFSPATMKIRKDLFKEIKRRRENVLV